MSAPTGPYEVCDWARAAVLGLLDACGRAPITTTYVGVGLPAWDDCCGQLVASPERVFRTIAFPVEAADEENCILGQLAVSVLVSLVRCVPVPSSTGHPPSASALSTAHQAVLDDAAIAWRALSGDLPEYWERAGLSQLFVGGDGGCISVETRLTLGVPSSLWCDGCEA